MAAGPYSIMTWGPPLAVAAGRMAPMLVKRDDGQGPAEQMISDVRPGVMMFLAINIWLVISIPLWLWTLERFRKVAANPERYRRSNVLRKMGRCFKTPKSWFKWCPSRVNTFGNIAAFKQVILMCNSAVTWRMLWRSNKLRLVIMSCLIAAAVAVGRQLHALVLLAGGQEAGPVLGATDLQATKTAMTSISANLQGPRAFTLLNIFIMVALPTLLYAVYSSCNPQSRQISIKLPSLRSFKSNGGMIKHPMKLYKKLPGWVRELLVSALVLTPYVAALLGYSSVVALAQEHLGHITGLQAFAVLNLIFAVFSIPLAFVLMKVGKLGKKMWKKVSCGRRRMERSAV